MWDKASLILYTIVVIVIVTLITIGTKSIWTGLGVGLAVAVILDKRDR
jgi:hypothetical protein